jgi:hypothetical protein
VRIRRHHVLHSFVSIALLAQLGFASAFVIDATQTNNLYDALNARHVTVTGQVLGCAVVQTRYSTPVCRVEYRYEDSEFSALVSPSGSMAYVVDPEDTSIRMSKVSFDGGPEATTVDLVLAIVLFAGAATTATLHLFHLRRRSSRRRSRMESPYR